MTREEAEEYAKKMTYRDAVYNALRGKCIPYRKATLIKLYELLDVIESQESDDAISRQAVLEKAYKVFRLYENNMRTETEVVEVLDIMMLPTVTPQQKVGRWIEKYHEKFKYYCDKCGAGSDLRTNFCPCCGVKMQEGLVSE